MAMELATSKPELLNEGLGGGGARGVGLGLRPGGGSREDHSLQHWCSPGRGGWRQRLARQHGSTGPSIGW